MVQRRRGGRFATKGCRVGRGETHPLPWRDCPIAPTPVPHAHLDLDKPTGDSVKTTTCYMCACRCGIRVHLKDGRDPLHRRQPDAPGQPRRDLREGLGRHHAALLAGAAFEAAAARRRARPRRVPRDRMGRGARASRPSWLGDDPRARSRTSSRSSPAATRSQALTGWWAQQFGTLNYAAHGGFCSVNMAAAGMYTIGGSFWEFGEPDWERTQATSCCSASPRITTSNPIKLGLGKLKARGAKIVVDQSGAHRLRRDRRRVDRDQSGHRRPVRRGADPRAVAHRSRSISTIWCATRMRSMLVIRDPGAADDGMFARDADGKPLRLATSRRERPRRPRRCDAGSRIAPSV